MKTDKLLNEIYYEQKANNRHVQRLTNVVLMGMLAMSAKDAKEMDNESGLKLCKLGLGFAMATEVLMVVEGIVDFTKKRKRWEE